MKFKPLLHVIVAMVAAIPMCVEGQTPMRILCIGNSYSADMVESWLSPMARTSGIELVIGNAVVGGYGLQEHWQSIVDGNAKTEYRKVTNDAYTLTPNQTLNEIINDESWDVITFQQNSQNSGIYSSYAPYLRCLIDYVKSIHPQAKLGWIMTWAYAHDTEHGGFSLYNRDQMTMYNAIVDATTHVMQDYPDFDFMVPCGTAVQNLRSSFLGDRVNRDGTHLNLYFGRYLVSYTFFATLFGEETARQNSYRPHFLNDATMRVVRSAALDAVGNPFAVTPQTYPEYIGDNPIAPADIQINFTTETKEPAGWNNVGVHHNFLAGLKDADGKDPGIFIFSNAEFSGGTYNGPAVTDTPLNIPAAVSITQLYGYSEGDISGVKKKQNAVIQFHHLNKALAYDFTFFASQENVADNRETQFTLAGANKLVATIDASDNRSDIASICDICPDDNGSVTLTVSAGPNNNNPNKLYLLNALCISAHTPDSIKEVGYTKKARKVIRAGHLYIIKDDRIYTPDGKRIN